MMCIHQKQTFERCNTLLAAQVALKPFACHPLFACDVSHSVIVSTILGNENFPRAV